MAALWKDNQNPEIYSPHLLSLVHSLISANRSITLPPFFNRASSTSKMHLILGRKYMKHVTFCKYLTLLS